MKWYICLAAYAASAFVAAAGAPEKKQYKDQQEYTLYDSVTKETDAAKKLALLNTWKERYPDSDFKPDRLQIFLTTYQQLGQPAKMIDTAKEILAIDPKDITALYWITFLSLTLGSTSADALEIAEEAANGLLIVEKPATVTDEEWTKAKSQTDAAAYTTLRWVGMQRKNNEVAEENFKHSLALDANAARAAQGPSAQTCPIVINNFNPSSLKAAAFAGLVGAERGNSYFVIGYTNNSPKQVMTVRFGVAYLNSMLETTHADSVTTPAKKLKSGKSASAFGTNETTDRPAVAWVEKILFADGEYWNDDGTHSCSAKP
jgi:tetratricopeptide (TPR) repeat protein